MVSGDLSVPQSSPALLLVESIVGKTGVAQGSPRML